MTEDALLQVLTDIRNWTRSCILRICEAFARGSFT